MPVEVAVNDTGNGTTPVGGVAVKFATKSGVVFVVVGAITIGIVETVVEVGNVIVESTPAIWTITIAKNKRIVTLLFTLHHSHPFFP